MSLFFCFFFFYASPVETPLNVSGCLLLWQEDAAGGPWGPRRPVGGCRLPSWTNKPGSGPETGSGSREAHGPHPALVASCVTRGCYRWPEACRSPAAAPLAPGGGAAVPLSKDADLFVQLDGPEMAVMPRSKEVTRAPLNIILKSSI